MKKLVLVLCLVAVGVGCSTSMKEANKEARLDAKDAKTWAMQMQGMAKTLEKLMPYVFSREEFTDPKNRVELKGLVSEYSQSVQHVPEHMGKKLLGDDPLVKYYLDNLKDGGVQSLKAFNEGHFDYSRNVLKDSVGHALTVIRPLSLVRRIHSQPRALTLPSEFTRPKRRIITLRLGSTIRRFEF